MKKNGIPILEVKQLTFAYSKQATPLLDSFDLRLYPGQISTLMGKSGMGKTTLLHLIAGLLNPNSGRVYLQGEPLPYPSELLVPGNSSICLAFQNQGLQAFRSCEANIRFAIKHWEKHFQDEKVEELLALCHLEEVALQEVTSLSGGQKQRLLLAMALAPEPSVLLLDEPFSQLDLPERRHLSKALLSAKNNGVSLLMVTHNAEDALSLSDEIYILREGKIIEQGSPQALYSHPSCNYTAGLLGYYALVREENGKSIALRPENIKVAENPSTGSIEAKLRQKYFLGQQFLVEFELLESGKLIEIFIPVSQEIPENVFLSWQKTNEMKLDCE